VEAESPKNEFLEEEVQLRVRRKMTELTATTLSQAVKEGFERMKRFRRARALFIKDYCGHYFKAEQGLTGEMPINLVFLAIHALVPALIQREGLNKVTTDFLGNKETAELLGLALNRLQKQLKMKQIMRAALVDTILGGFFIAKTSIAASGLLIPIGDDEDVDPGMVYTDVVSMDDFTFDPTALAFDKANFMGHRLRVPRQQLVELGMKQEIVDRLPSASQHPMEKDWAQSMTQDSKQAKRMFDLQDYVYVVEVCVPEAEAVAYIPDPQQLTLDDFLLIKDYYGPAEGPYTIGSLTQPVPDNPFPIAPVGVYRDLNDMANEIFKKFMGQSERQKDVLLYRPELADVAEAIRTAEDGASIACNDPNGVNVASFGGQNPDNERMIQELRGWFNYMAGNPDQMMGIATSNADTATEFQGLQANASLRVEDMRTMMAESYADISKKQAWFIFYDPLMFQPGQPGIPLIRRITGGEEIQVYLTPEQMRGDFLEYSFEIVKRSMTILEPTLRSKRLLDYYTNVVPAMVQSAMVMMQMGIEFDLPRALMQAAEELGIDEVVQEVFIDPKFAQRMETFMMFGPQNPGKGQLAGVLQNGGFAGQRPVASPATEQNQMQQMTAGEAQSAAGFGGQQFG